MLPLSLDCIHPVFCVPTVASVPGLSLSCVPSVASVSVLYSFCVLCAQYKDNTETLATLSTQDKTKIIQGHWQQWAHKTQDEYNTETLATFGTQDKDNPGTLATVGTQNTG
jgi:hypothetical protein